MMHRSRLFSRIRIRTGLTAVAALLALASACTPADSPRGVADRFVDAYYVRIDLKSAAELSTGLALDRINEEIQLTKGQSIDAATRRPTVHYSLASERNADDAVTFVFNARFDVPDAGTFERNLMITARQDGGHWKVSNFSEFE
jgi:hypothetical protein